MTALVIGLGNPGEEYAATRHNVGTMVLEELAARAGASLSVHKRTHTRATVARLAGQAVQLGVPMSYMNVSGGPVSSLAKYVSVPPAEVIVVHDELDIPFGTVRLKRGGGSGGHNGLKDVTKALGTPDYIRVRIGIGRPPGRMDAATFVLKPFSAAERKELPFLISDGADAVEAVLADGLEAAQQRFHSPS
ncbi:aminoacyl-tRNA hydrolase [Demequina capsici]|uniref:Peptidyl-tRNA hydrolase n=1 Tax=Demequina capsici TaxID=3075620 RepID=A0AA96FE90_9MICO|nr:MULTISPECIES: aminoacyl-tRNA hydrolase [unclassified Demequina]WNM25034.1 aminoacyl-tRNA hydrolase [Demequina sp. OYTSA14]WNM27940.1 aminoacyl-tRNA hydrolase [Demequina sp. PMTSA13]